MVNASAQVVLCGNRRERPAAGPTNCAVWGDPNSRMRLGILFAHVHRHPMFPATHSFKGRNHYNTLHQHDQEVCKFEVYCAHASIFVTIHELSRLVNTHTILVSAHGCGC
jgi:hypothetical protein